MLIVLLLPSLIFQTSLLYPYPTSQPHCPFKIVFLFKYRLNLVYSHRYRAIRGSVDSLPGTTTLKHLTVLPFTANNNPQPGYPV